MSAKAELLSHVSDSVSCLVDLTCGEMHLLFFFCVYLTLVLCSLFPCGCQLSIYLSLCGTHCVHCACSVPEFDMFLSARTKDTGASAAAAPAAGASAERKPARRARPMMKHNEDEQDGLFAL